MFFAKSRIYNKTLQKFVPYFFSGRGPDALGFRCIYMYLAAKFWPFSGVNHVLHFRNSAKI